MAKHSIIPSTRLADSLRSTNHTMKTAFGDLVDNSIAAGAKNIWIDIRQVDKKARIVIADDGCGMDVDTLVAAFTLGCHNDDSDDRLGRFGMGLKTSGAYLGNSFRVLTKMKSQKVICGVYDPEEMKRTGRWEVEVDNANPEYVLLFSSMVKNGSGTLIVIDDVNYIGKENSITSNLPAQLIKYLGQTFRYFVGGKVNMFVNHVKISAIDPLERDKVGAIVKLDEDIKTDHGTLHVVGVELERGKGDAYYSLPPSETHQGIYYVRENREILAADVKLLSEFWGSTHPSMNYCRVEVSYTGLDDEFLVNHDKCGIKEIAQSMKDKLKEMKPFLADCKSHSSRLSSAALVTDSATKENNEAVSKLLNSKASTLILPPADVEKRDGAHNSSGSIHSTHSGKNRIGKNMAPYQSDRFEVRTEAGGEHEPLFRTENEGRKIIVIWNSAHAFYSKFVSDSPLNQLKGLTALMAMVECSWQKEIKDEAAGSVETRTAEDLYDSFKTSLAVNLRAVAK